MMNKSIARKSALVTRLLVTLLAALVLAGCTRGMSDLRAWVAQEKVKKGAPIPPLPVIKTFETFKYEDQDKRDPFSPSTTELQNMLRQLLRQLPSKTEMPELLTDISQTAQAAGLEPDLFQPGPETPKDFSA